MRFKEKVAIVTGGASGIGLATARRLGSEGSRVIVADLDAAKGRAAAEQVRAAGALDAVASPCDVAREDQVQATVTTAFDRFGRLDGVVNNAGLVKSGAETIDPADVGRPEDIAAVIAYLLSEDAQFVQGAMVRVDGGRLIASNPAATPGSVASDTAARRLPIHIGSPDAPLHLPILLFRAADRCVDDAAPERTIAGRVRHIEPRRHYQPRRFQSVGAR